MEISLLAENPQASKVIAQWYYDEWLSEVDGVSIENISDNVLKSATLDRLPATLLGYKADDLVGVVEVKYRENKNYPEYEHWLGGLFVKMACRGQGISSILISKAINYARNSEIQELYLQCESHNIDLYKKHGFKLLHSGKHRVPVSIMKLDINR